MSYRTSGVMWKCETCGTTYRTQGAIPSGWVDDSCRRCSDNATLVRQRDFRALLDGIGEGEEVRNLKKFERTLKRSVGELLDGGESLSVILDIVESVYRSRMRQVELRLARAETEE